MPRSSWILLGGLLICWARPAAAAPISRTISVRAAVPLSAEYEWSIRQRSQVTGPDEAVPGANIGVVGQVRGAEGRIERSRPIVLMIGQNDQTLTSAITWTDAAGDYSFQVAAEWNWRGDLWWRLALLTNGRPLWLTDRRPLSVAESGCWQGTAADETLQIDWKIGEGVAAGEQLSTLRTEQSHDTISLIEQLANYGEQRRLATDSNARQARGRDSPFVVVSDVDVGGGRSLGPSGRGHQ